MGLLPDRLPGYAPVSDAAAREMFGKLWGAALPDWPGLDARKMLTAATEGKLKALYIVGSNPVKTFVVPTPERLKGLELLVVQEMFLTETAARADVVLPAACAYEKNGTVTNTAGEVQLLRQAADVMGPRSDFDILRILSHQLTRLGLGSGTLLRTPEAVFEEIRRNVRGYDVSMANLLAGGAEPSAAHSTADGRAPYDVPPEAIFSSRDALFTSGTLGRYCKLINSLPEAQAKP
jgi:NADH-quinone oxidoreductase subunit G